MKTKNLITLFLFFLAFTACKQGQNIEIGFLIHSSSNSRWQMDIACLNERANELGAKLIVKDAQNDENIQLKQASELLDSGVDILIVVAANQNTAGGIVRAAHKKGVKVISYDRLIKNADLDYLVSFEYEKVGELMVEYVANKEPKGNCIMFWGDANDANAQFIKTGQERALKETANAQLNIIYRSFIEGWDRATAKEQMDEILDFSGDKIDAVISSNIPLAMGVVESLKTHGYDPGSVTITGMDASAEFINSMNEGGMSMSVLKPIKELASGAIDLAVDVVKNKNISFSKTVNNGRIDVPAKLLPPLIIDKSNYESEVIAKGYVSSEELMNQVVNKEL